MNRKIRWGILGTGKIACDLAQGIQQVEAAELVAVASRSESRAADFAIKFGDVRPHDSYAELVESDDLDVIYIATPNHRHHDDCHLCLDAGKPILCEKPFALNRALSEQIIHKAREKQLFCMEAMWMRCMPLLQRVKAAVKDGHIGEPNLLVADFGYPVPRTRDNRFYSLEMGGGALLDRGVYVASLAHFLLGKPTTVQGAACLSETGVDEQAAMTLQFESGSVASLMCSMTHRTTNSATLYGSQGSIQIHTPFFRPHRVVVRKGNANAVTSDPIASLPSGTAGMWKSKLKNKLQSWYRSCESFLPPIVTSGKSASIWTDTRVGNGYHYEVAEVCACLRSGQLESKWMPLDETLDVMETLDQLRHAWGIKYPQE